MKITKQALLDRGFAPRPWTDEGETFIEYDLFIGQLNICIYGDNLQIVELYPDTDTPIPIPIPNCRTLKQLDALIDLFKE